MEELVSCDTVAERSGREHGSWGIYIAGRRNLETGSEDKLTELIVSCSEKSNARISDCVISTYSYGFNKCNYQSKHRV
jgi:hypothetical protein